MGTNGSGRSGDRVAANDNGATEARGPVRRVDHRPPARAPDRPRAVRAAGFNQRQYAGQGDRRPTGAMT